MDRAAFFNALRGGFTGTIEPAEMLGTEAVLDTMAGQPASWTAYALGTAYHETNGTLQPVREAYWLSEAWRRTHLRYYPFYGRGYVQLTWRENYARADKELGLNGDLLKNLDLAMRADIAARVMLLGMTEGWFAGDRKGRHNFERHLPGDSPASVRQFEAARRIINGADKAHTVATYASGYQNALIAGGW